MSRRPGFSASKKRAVENAWDRPGMQAKAGEVIAALARQGIEVSEELVVLVRFGLRRKPVRSANPHTPGKRPAVRRRIMPAPRTRR